MGESWTVRIPVGGEHIIHDEFLLDHPQEIELADSSVRIRGTIRYIRIHNSSCFLHFISHHSKF